jgi:hypothetical protein
MKHLEENSTPEQTIAFIKEQLKKGTTKPNKKVINALRKRVAEQLEELHLLFENRLNKVL